MAPKPFPCCEQRIDLVSSLPVSHPIAPVSAPALVLTTPPTMPQLLALWEVLTHEPTALASYSDRFPQTALAASVAHEEGTFRLWVALERHTPVGCWWVHDRGNDARGLYGWLGCYFVPAVRGARAVQSFPLVRAMLATYGLTRLCCAIRRGNRAAQHFARRCGFTRVGVYQDFTQFRGTWDGVILYCLDPTDAPHVWRAAANRSLAHHALVAIHEATVTEVGHAAG